MTRYCRKSRLLLQKEGFSTLNTREIQPRRCRVFSTFFFVLLGSAVFPVWASQTSLRAETLRNHCRSLDMHCPQLSAAAPARKPKNSQFSCFFSRTFVFFYSGESWEEIRPTPSRWSRLLHELTKSKFQLPPRRRAKILAELQSMFHEKVWLY